MSNQREKLLISGVFRQTKELLDKAIAKHAAQDGFCDNLLVDWHEGNVIVDLNAPAGGMPFTFCIIDQ